MLRTHKKKESAMQTSISHDLRIEGKRKRTRIGSYFLVRLCPHPLIKLGALASEQKTTTPTTSERASKHTREANYALELRLAKKQNQYKYWPSSTIGQQQQQLGENFNENAN